MTNIKDLQERDYFFREGAEGIFKKIDMALGQSIKSKILEYFRIWDIANLCIDDVYGYRWRNV